MYWQVALVFGLIGLLGLVLRWAFGRDPALPRRRPRRRSLLRRRAGTARNQARPETSPISPAAGTGAAAPSSAGGTREDYGLLAVAAEVGTSEEATTLRRALRDAGIRNTSAMASDGKHKVLVFGHDLMRARRVAGGTQGGTGGTQGAGNS